MAIADDEETKIDYSSDSWSAPLLCKECESDLNNRYDRYGISLLKGKACRVHRTAEGVTFSSVDRQRLRMFVLSVLWRMAVSPHRAYGNIDIPHDVEAEIRNALRDKRNVRPVVAEAGFCRLKESTGAKTLSMENLQRMLIMPFSRDYIAFRSICFLLFGFVIEVFSRVLREK